MKTILAPIDLSPISEAVVQSAAELARAFDAHVVLLTIVPRPMVLGEYAGLMNLEEVVAAAEKEAAQQIGRFEEQLNNDFIKSRAISLSGTPVAQILSHAEKCEADFIVMGSHGHTALYDMLVGSTTQGVLKRASCPVVIVPARRRQPDSLRAERRRVAV